jgi:hypothetical protein
MTNIYPKKNDGRTNGRVRVPRHKPGSQGTPVGIPKHDYWRLGVHSVL